MQLKLLLFLFVATPTMGEKILFYFGFSSYSHRVAVWPLVAELAAKGHEVTFFSPFPNKNPDPKVREFTASKKLVDELGEFDMVGSRLSQGKRLVQFVSLFQLPYLTSKVCELTLKDPASQQWIQKEKFDLIVLDGLFNECGLILAHKYGSKTAIFQTGSVLGKKYLGMLAKLPKTFLTVPCTSIIFK